VKSRWLAGVYARYPPQIIPRRLVAEAT